ncbi:DUF6316 family protein [Aliikangiella sp. G2MR2-5]|uniref:DUF6316 family protein n=1 Tax=Aliikangiella sp. G2MR2-5 TaxID=2788943 RepID=UPI0018A8F54C|nr:DUF6316 family protein [Aliikangiella sp. G2MR2-5]
MSQYSYRNGEPEAHEFSRSGRFFKNNGYWFFKTREGVDYGPYSDRVECRYAYNEFIEMVSSHIELGSVPIDFGETESEKARDWRVPKIDFN